jgi:Methyltransferase domain
MSEIANDDEPEGRDHWGFPLKLEGGRVMEPLEALISERPHFHIDGAGKPANWSVPPDVLRFIWSCLKPSMRTLETGAGQSTVAFAIVGTHHVCITPKQDEAQRIRSYCREHRIEDDKITFIHESSDIALASGRDIPDVLDFVFIDGAHQFPFPILDWHFSAQKIPVGGIVVIDDYLRRPSGSCTTSSWKRTNGNLFSRSIPSCGDITEHPSSGASVTLLSIGASASRPLSIGICVRILTGRAIICCVFCCAIHELLSVGSSI